MAPPVQPSLSTVVACSAVRQFSVASASRKRCPFHPRRQYHQGTVGHDRYLHRLGLWIDRRTIGSRAEPMTKVDVKYYVRDAIRPDTVLSTESRGHEHTACRRLAQYEVLPDGVFVAAYPGLS
jgi:hypothetical protein